MRPLHGRLRRCPADRRDRDAGPRPRDEGRGLRRRHHGVVGVHVLWPVCRDVSHRRAAAEGSPGSDRPSRRHDVPLLRRGLRHRRGRACRRPPRGHGRRRSRQPVEPGHAVREGPLRDRVRSRARSRHDAAREDRRELARDLVGRGARRGGRRTGPASSPLRRAGQCQGHQRGRLRDPEVRARRDGHEQRRSLHAALSFTLGGGDARLDGLGRHVQLVRRLRGGWLRHGRGRRRLRESSRDRHPLPTRDASGRAHRRGEPEANRAGQPGRSLDRPAAGHRRDAVQRDGKGDPRRGPRQPGFRPDAHRGVRGLGALTRGLHPPAGRARHRRVGAGHRSGRALVRQAAGRSCEGGYAPLRTPPGFVPGVGDGGHPARQRHSQRPRAAEPLARHRSARISRCRNLAAARTKQRPGLR